MSNSTGWRSLIEYPRTKKCWICGEIFQKGKQKKILSVSSIIIYFRHLKGDGGSSVLEHLTSESGIKSCWIKFYDNSVGDESDNLDLTYKEIYDLKLTPDSSTLVCCRSDDCSTVYDNIIRSETSALRGGKDSLLNSNPSDPLCPPGCGCDNPWPFIANV